MRTRFDRARRRSGAARAVHWMLACLFTVLALLLGTVRVSPLESVRRGAFSLEDARSSEQEPALKQQGELCRVPGVRPARGPFGGEPPRVAPALRALFAADPATRRFSECGVVQDSSALYVWTPRPKARSELMVFLN